MLRLVSVRARGHLPSVRKQKPPSEIFSETVGGKHGTPLDGVDEMMPGISEVPVRVSVADGVVT